MLDAAHRYGIRTHIYTVKGCRPSHQSNRRSTSFYLGKLANLPPHLYALGKRLFVMIYIPVANRFSPQYPVLSICLYLLAMTALVPSTRRHPDLNRRFNAYPRQPAGVSRLNSYFLLLQMFFLLRKPFHNSGEIFWLYQEVIFSNRLSTLCGNDGARIRTLITWLRTKYPKPLDESAITSF